MKQKVKSWIALYEFFAEDIISEDELKDKLQLHKNFNLYKHLKVKINNCF